MSLPVWMFFSAAAACITCSAQIPRGKKKLASFNTTNLICHSKVCHCGKEILKEYEVVTAAVTGTKTKTRSDNLPIEQALENCKKFSRDNEKAKAINNKVMEVIVLDDQPFSVVQDLGFPRLNK